MRWADIEVPNLPVDVNSWGRSACYPRGTFYPLSDGASTCNHRITKTVFPLCSACLPYSQAPLYLYALRTISSRAEGTFVRLRYSLGGDRPSQTARQTLFSTPIAECKLETQFNKGGISRLTPPRPKPQLHSLPPILRMLNQISMPSCSKGPRGLSVLP